MTLLQLSQEYAYSAELLSRRIAQLRREEAAAEGADEDRKSVGRERVF